LFYLQPEFVGRIWMGY